MGLTCWVLFRQLLKSRHQFGRPHLPDGAFCKLRMWRRQNQRRYPLDIPLGADTTTAGVLLAIAPRSPAAHGHITANDSRRSRICQQIAGQALHGKPTTSPRVLPFDRRIHPHRCGSGRAIKPFDTQVNASKAWTCRKRSSGSPFRSVRDPRPISVLSELSSRWIRLGWDGTAPAAATRLRPSRVIGIASAAPANAGLRTAPVHQVLRHALSARMAPGGAASTRKRRRHLLTT
jgi:hypothetical protein